jgi:hypothetical protein
MISVTTTLEELELAAEKVERWLAAMGFDDVDGTTSMDGDNPSDNLRAINALARAGAPDDELADAVNLARDSGWSWSPIAMVLGVSRQEAVARFG